MGNKRERGDVDKNIVRLKMLQTVKAIHGGNDVENKVPEGSKHTDDSHTHSNEKSEMSDNISLGEIETENKADLEKSVELVNSEELESSETPIKKSNTNAIRIKEERRGVTATSIVGIVLGCVAAASIAVAFWIRKTTAVRTLKL